MPDLLQLIDQDHIQRDWIHIVPQYLIDITSRKELKRQAAIAELISTEQNYIQDLLILHNVYALPLLESSEIIAESDRRQNFYQSIFSNYLEIIQLHHRFFHAIKTKKRQSGPLIGRIGTTLMDHANRLMDPYMAYTSNHNQSLYVFNLELESNPHFASFLEAQNSQRFTRRLGLRHYLTAPTLWIGRFKLMVEAILKHTEDDGDQLALQVSLTLMHDTLCRMNNEMKQDCQIPHIYQGFQKLSIPPNSQLLLKEEVRLARPDHPLHPSVCHLFLFTHALVLSRWIQNKYITVEGSPIPIQMVHLHTDLHSFRDKERLQERIKTRLSRIKTQYFSASVPVSPTTHVSVVRRESAPVLKAKDHSIGLSIKKRCLCLTHLARPHHTFRLEFGSRSQRNYWETRIRQAALESMRHEPLKTTMFNIPVDGIQCACVFNYLDQSFIALGCQTGLWIQEKDQGRWVVRDQEISQISIINDKFFILSCSVLKSYPLQDMMYPGLLEGHLIKSKVFCFQTGILRSQPVVVYVTKKGAQKDLTLTSVTLTPSSGHWLKKYKKEQKVGWKQIRQLQIVDDTLFFSYNQGIGRADGSIVVNETHQGFIVSGNQGFLYHGQQVHQINLFHPTATKKILFDSNIQQLAIKHPYLVAFSPFLVEIRHVETGQLVQVICGHHIQCVSQGPDILFIMSTTDHPEKILYQL
ncbi:hypothetical protein G6F56_007293 [Rhizopus delemar]|nr:hypothetical protein G6F56_007293 [Rhizopus delemar]